METVVAVAIGILASIFVASLVGLVFVCRQKCRRQDHITQQMKDTRYIEKIHFIQLHSIWNGYSFFAHSGVATLPFLLTYETEFVLFLAALVNSVLPMG